ncbi:leucine-rich repeat domain-containing protein [Flagellimonas meridianipacifica]|uniref:Leucine-rich repeat (LRR) protein n=1 Tax=Flagellimonas meridianipacifica TaxID=1080225 RepID=A0A2T0MIY0_9FLAO|nr:leucine-rich repeat domain-containing protein [Allomuricauda pacifica]PRX57513.1 Leucine-rich repeat (LRR) protein [Allomuricauda pacifica]
MKTQYLIFAILLLLLVGCSKDDGATPEPIIEPEQKSSEKQLISFRFTGIEKDGITVDIPAEIDQTAKTIGAEIPSGTDITAMEPEIEISDKATYEPTGPQDFSNPINYTVTAEDGTSRTYLVTIAVALSQKEILLKIAEANPGNTLSWNENDDISDWEEISLDSIGNIIELRLNSRDISFLPPEIGQLSELIILDLEDNSLPTLPVEIWQIFNLRELDLTAIGLSALPPEIGQLENLTTLSLSLNNLVDLPPEIGNLSNLRELFVTTNNLPDLPPEIGQLSSLMGLYLSDNELSALPPELGQLSNLQVLYLSGNDLSTLPPEIGQLSSLGALILAGNNLSEIPSEFQQLSNLVVLDLRNNELSGLGTNHIPMVNSDPLTISCESNLQVLWLAENKKPMVLDDCICDLDKDHGGTVDIDIVLAPDPENPNPSVVCQGDVIGK